MAYLPPKLIRVLKNGIILILILGSVVMFVGSFNYARTGTFSIGILSSQSIQSYMPAHHPGTVITDITVLHCRRFDPFCSLDWPRIEKDLYLGESWTHTAYLHYQQKQRVDLGAGDSIILEVSVGRLEPSLGVNGKSSGEWVKKGSGLWLKKALHESHPDADAITSVEVLFGADAVDPRDGWTLTGTSLLLGTSGEKHEAKLSVRKGSPKQPPKPVLRIDANGKFKIMQVADLHLSTGTGLCRDVEPNERLNCEADPKTLDFVSKLLDHEKPDLVILSGDQVNGETAPDAQTAILKYAAVFTDRKIPYASIFGNHDDIGSRALSRSKQMRFIETLPYSLSEAGPEAVDGVGNYVVEVYASGHSQHSALTVYLLDTHGTTLDEKKSSRYDYIKEGQIQWFRNTAKALKKKHDGYTHIHMDVAFIHIPLPEYRDELNDENVVGAHREHVMAPTYNSGFKEALIEQGVVMVSCGHDHANEYCLMSPNPKTTLPALWMCYAGGVGFGGYGAYKGWDDKNYIRRVRFFDFDMNQASILTYKIADHGDSSFHKIDEMSIAQGGKAIAAPASQLGQHWNTPPSKPTDTLGSIS